MTFARETLSKLGPLAWISLGFVVLLAFVAVFATVIAPHDYAAQSLSDSSIGPNGTYWLGTDTLGRDIFSRMLVGTRTGLIGPLVVAVFAGIIGTALGLWTGFAGGRVDAGVMRSIDLVYAVPPLLVAIVLVGLLGGGYWLAVAVLIALSAPGDVRVVRAAVLSQRELPYVAAAQTVGVGSTAVAIRHVLPNVSPTVVANVLLQFVVALIALSGLAFLGLGVDPGSPDWGLMIAENRGILDLNPWAVIAPAIAITVLAIAMTILGDRTHEVLTELNES
jgi:peptide/nickel transport system permease protein